MATERTVLPVRPSPVLGVARVAMPQWGQKAIRGTARWQFEQTESGPICTSTASESSMWWSATRTQTSSPAAIRP